MDVFINSKWTILQTLIPRGRTSLEQPGLTYVLPEALPQGSYYWRGGLRTQPERGWDDCGVYTFTILLRYLLRQIWVSLRNKLVHQ